MEAIGFLSYYGFSPPIDILRKEGLGEQEEINILVSESGDIRHLLKTISDNVSESQSEVKINVSQIQISSMCTKDQKKI